ncbi:hypothetical protein [Limosilactobacillus reuteri]|uniref:hypothetical protein n=1 Tax=Limosilactobacillus reuteri TaxID=1598 RepID=UPI001CDC5E9C|nr:hypothetical protein [Limosilactobacillus reuteri]
MRTTKNWGFTNSGAELHMLAHAERTRKELERESARSNQNTSKHHRQRSCVFQHGKR